MGPRQFSIFSSHQANESAVGVLLKGFSGRWSNRAMVRRRDIDTVPVFDAARPDFLEELLPFKSSEYYLSAPQEVKNRILTCGWLIYNEKTMAIESDVVTPACELIARGQVPGLYSRDAKEVASETAIDEAYHSLLVLRANHLTNEARGITVNVPEFDIVCKMNECLARYDEQWKKVLVRVAVAVVSEIFVSNYLKKMGDPSPVQPCNTLTVRTHRVDELAHGSAFKLLAKEICQGLNQEQKDFFSEILPKPVRWFASKELTVWECVLNQIGFGHAGSMIAECRALEEVDMSSIDYSGLIKLASEIGVISSLTGQLSFSQEGLLDGVRNIRR